MSSEASHIRCAKLALCTLEQVGRCADLNPQCSLSATVIICSLSVIDEIMQCWQVVPIQLACYVMGISLKGSLSDEPVELIHCRMQQVRRGWQVILDSGLLVC